jgi:hypothetical protein
MNEGLKSSKKNLKSGHIHNMMVQELVFTSKYCIIYLQTSRAVNIGLWFFFCRSSFHQALNI